MLRHIAAGLVLVTLFGGAPLVRAEEAADHDGRIIRGGGETFVYSRYLSRGMALSEGPVLQPSAWLAWEDFTVNVLGSMPLDRELNQGRFNEVNLSLAWNGEWHGVLFEPKLTLLSYPNTSDQSQYEAGITVGYDIGHWRLATFHSVTVAAAEKGFYYGELSLGYRRDLSASWSLNGELWVSWPMPTAAAGLEGKLAYRLTRALTLSLQGGCSIIRSDAATADVHDSDLSDFLPQGRNGFVGIGLGYEF